MKKLTATLLTVFAFLWIICIPAFGLNLADVPVKYAKVDGAEFGYRTIGQGRPLLMITGYCAAMDVWDPILVDELAKSFKVVMFDNRGVGYSGLPDSPFTIPGMADDAAGILNGLGIKSAYVMGWSMGGTIAQEMALNHPETVDKLVLYDTAANATQVLNALEEFSKLPQDELASHIFPQDWVKENPDIFKRLPAPANPITAEIAGMQKKAIEKWSGTESRLPGIKKSTIIIVGEQDFITPPAESLDMAEKIAGSWLVRYDRAGHWLMYQCPEEMAGIVTFFPEHKAKPYPKTLIQRA